MAVLGYNGHYISVFLTPDKSGNSSCIPFVEIRHKGDRGPLARLMLKEAFETADAASAHGLEMGKKWVDEQNTKNKLMQIGGAVRKVTSKLKPGAFGFKSWLASLFL
jgi:hypothetical protein